MGLTASLSRTASRKGTRARQELTSSPVGGGSAMCPELVGNRRADPQRQRIGFVDRVDELPADRLVAFVAIVRVVGRLVEGEVTDLREAGRERAPKLRQRLVDAQREDHLEH